MKTKHHSTTALTYASALLELAEEQKQTDAIGADLVALADAVQNNAALKLFTVDPSIGVAERARVLKQGFGGKISPLLLNFLGVLNKKNRLNLLPEIGPAYADLLDEKRGKVEVDVTVAHKLSPEELQQVQQKVSQALGKTAVVSHQVDDSIIGGMKLQVQDKLIDASVKYQLEAIKHQLLAKAPK